MNDDDLAELAEAMDDIPDEDMVESENKQKKVKPVKSKEERD
jgi:hypothetical protein